MRMRPFWVGTVCFLLAGSASAQVKDPAELVPSQTLAYLEIRNPEQLSRELAALTKGSYLDNMPARMAKFREKLADKEDFFYGSYMLGMFSSLLAPEVLAEAGRLQGGAVALTGFNKDREPEIVGIVLAGDSHAPTFFLRMTLTMGQVRMVSEVEGVQLYRERSRDYRNFKGGPGEAQPPLRDNGPTFAMLPGVVIIGSTTDSVKDVVRRIKGKNADPALSGKTAFKEAVKQRERPGLFGYVDVAALADQLDEVYKNDRSPNALMWANVKTLINAKAVHSLTAGLTVQNGGLDLQAQLTLDPKQTSPLLELLADKKAAPELLHAVPRDSLLAVTMALPEGEKRWEKLLALLDAFAKEAGQPRADLPSNGIQEIEKKLKLAIGKEIMAKVNGLALALNTRGDLPKGGMRVPMLIANTVDGNAAKTLEDMIPKLVSLAGRGEETLPTTERIQGQAVRSLPGENLPWRTPLYYGRVGTTLVFGQNRDAVADALLGAGDKKGLLGEPKVAEAVKGFEEPIVLGTWSAGQTLTLLLKEWSNQPDPVRKDFPREKGDKEPDINPPPRNGGASPAGKAEADKLVQDLVKVMEPQAPSVFALTRKTDRLTLELRQPSLRGVSAKVIDVVLDALLHQASLGRGGFGFGGGIIGPGVEDVPLPPPIEKKDELLLKLATPRIIAD